MVRRILLGWQLACVVVLVAWVGFWCARGHPLLATLGALGVLLQVWWAQIVNHILAWGHDRFAVGARYEHGVVLQRLRDWCLESARITWVLGFLQIWRCSATPDHLQGANPALVGVLFLHGHFGNRGIWHGWMQRLQAQNRACVALSLEPLGADLDAYAPAIEAAVQALTTACAGRPPLLVCHSMGGLAARAWWRAWRQAQQAAGGVPVALGERVAGVVTLGTPHQGAWLARLGQAHNVRQMRLGNSWLQALNGAEPSAELKGLAQSWAGRADVVVFTPSACTWPGADSVVLQACGHAGLVFDARVRAATEALLHRLDLAPRAMATSANQPPAQP